MEQARSRLDFVAEQLAEHLLFVDEAPIDNPITGVSTFTKTFSDRERATSRGVRFGIST